MTETITPDPEKLPWLREYTTRHPYTVAILDQSKDMHVWDKAEDGQHTTSTPCECAPFLVMYGTHRGWYHEFNPAAAAPVPQGAHTIPKGDSK